MFTKPPTASPRILLVAAAVFSFPWATQASEEPENRRPESGPVQEVESIQSPQGPAYVEPESIDGEAKALEPTILLPTAEHRGGVVTDAGDGLFATFLTPSERAKLDLARAAVEASRAAGTLEVHTLPEDTIPATQDELAAMKMQQLEARRSQAPAADPVAGVGQDLPSVQELGPSGLTPFEQAKLRGEIIPPSVLEESAPTALGEHGEILNAQPADDSNVAPAPRNDEGDSR